jgi:hypothetical protein
MPRTLVVFRLTAQAHETETENGDGRAILPELAGGNAG